jgi:hypothetical protein
VETAPSGSCTFTALITKSSGGSIKIYFPTKNNGSLTGTLVFPAGAVSADVTVTLSMDKQSMREIKLDFSPSAVFLKPAILNFVAYGLDLSWIKPSTEIGFFYYNPVTGKSERMIADKVVVNVSNGYMYCLNAQVPHFSRYGFGR